MPAISSSSLVHFVIMTKYRHAYSLFLCIVTKVAYTEND